MCPDAPQDSTPLGWTQVARTVTTSYSSTTICAQSAEHTETLEPAVGQGEFDSATESLWFNLPGTPRVPGRRAGRGWARVGGVQTGVRLAWEYKVSNSARKHRRLTVQSFSLESNNPGENLPTRVQELNSLAEATNWKASV